MTTTPPPYGPPPYPPPTAPSSRGRFAAAVLAGALVVGAGAGVGGAAAWSLVSDSGSGSDASSFNVDATPAVSTKSGGVESVASNVRPSVVELDVEAGGAGGSGSGVVLNDAGLILTNNHVVTLDSQVTAKQAQVTASFSNGTKVEATVVGTDPVTDTALVQVHGVKDLHPITIGHSGNLAVGQQVVAIGSPYGLDSTVTSGIVSALDRPVDVGRDQSGNITAYPAIQTDAAINPGNSGGALVDMSGHLVGINASIRTGDDATGQGGSIGLGFAIPIDEILPIVEQLKAGETPTHARLGISITDVAQHDGQSLAQVTDGAEIRQIVSGSAAGAAGLKTGDVITRVDEHPITGADSLIATIRAYRPGQQVQVTYERDGSSHTTRLRLGSDADSA
ncbi:S1C family serine protease [Nocardioides montaniterrae]